MITTSEVKTRVEKFYPDNLHGESFNDGDLGGCNVFGDPATHYPIMWKHLVKKFDIKTVIDIGCGFGYTVDFFKKSPLLLHSNKLSFKCFLITEIISTNFLFIKFSL